MKEKHVFGFYVYYRFLCNTVHDMHDDNMAWSSRPCASKDTEGVEGGGRYSCIEAGETNNVRTGEKCLINVRLLFTVVPYLVSLPI